MDLRGGFAVNFCVWIQNLHAPQNITNNFLHYDSRHASKNHRHPTTMTFTTMFTKMFLPTFLGGQPMGRCKYHLERITTGNFWTEPWEKPWMEKQEKHQLFVENAAESRKINFLTGVPGSGKTTHTKYIINNRYKDGKLSGVFYMYPNTSRDELPLLEEFKRRVFPQHPMPLVDSLSSTKDSNVPLMVIIDEMDYMSWDNERLDGELGEFFDEFSDAVDNNNISVIVVCRSESFMDKIESKVPIKSRGQRFKMNHTTEEVLKYVGMFPESERLSDEQRKKLAEVASKGGAISLVNRFFEDLRFNRNVFDQKRFDKNMANTNHLSSIWLEMNK